MVVVFVVVLLMVPVLVVCATCIAALGLRTVLVQTETTPDRASRE